LNNSRRSGRREASFGEKPSVSEKLIDILHNLRVLRIFIVLWNLIVIFLMLVYGL